jgi:hypothetical protein
MSATNEQRARELTNIDRARGITPMAKLQRTIAAALDDAERRGADREREAVVAWLRAQPGDALRFGAASCIEVGDHRKPEPEPDAYRDPVFYNDGITVRAEPTSGRVNTTRECRACDGKGHLANRTLGETRTCRECRGTGTVEPGKERGE